MDQTKPNEEIRDASPEIRITTWHRKALFQKVILSFFRRVQGQLWKWQRGAVRGAVVIIRADRQEQTDTAPLPSNHTARL